MIVTVVNGAVRMGYTISKILVYLRSLIVEEKSI